MRPIHSLVVGFFICFLSDGFAQDGAWTKDRISEDEITSITAKMSNAEKVGQLLFVGFQSSTLNDSLKNHLLAVRPGGVIFFRRNIRSAEQISKLTHDIRDLFAAHGIPPPFLAIDQEGGTVTRIQRSPPAPSALAMGRAGDPEIIERLGEDTGRVLKTLGFNMNLAPVLDLADPNKPSFIASRSFSNDPNIVGSSALAFLKGQEKNRVITTLKHFPGNGGEIADPHLRASLSQQTAEQVAERNLAPYLFVSKNAHVPAVMVAHVAYPALDPTGVPATYSVPMLTGILRDKMKFESVAISDDLQMAGAKVQGAAGERAERALNAGIDLVMFSWSTDTQRVVLSHLTNSLEKGTLKGARVEESLRRILKTKLRYGLFDKATRPTKTQLTSVLADPAHSIAVENLMKNIFRFALPKNQKRLSRPDSYRPVLVFSYSDAFFTQLSSELPDAQRLPVQLEPLSEHLAKYENSEVIFYVTGPQSANLARALSPEARARTIVVNASIPGLINDAKMFKNVIDLFNHYPRSGKWLARSIFKLKQEPERLPSSAFHTEDSLGSYQIRQSP